MSSTDHRFVDQNPEFLPGRSGCTRECISLFPARINVEGLIRKSSRCQKTKSNLRIIKSDFCTRAVEARFTNEMEKDDVETTREEEEEEAAEPADSF